MVDHARRVVQQLDNACSYVMSNAKTKHEPAQVDGTIISCSMTKRQLCTSHETLQYKAHKGHTCALDLGHYLQ